MTRTGSGSPVMGEAGTLEPMSAGHIHRKWRGCREAKRCVQFIVLAGVLFSAIHGKYVEETYCNKNDDAARVNMARVNILMSFASGVSVRCTTQARKVSRAKEKDAEASAKRSAQYRLTRSIILRTSQGPAAITKCADVMLSDSEASRIVGARHAVPYCKSEILRLRLRMAAAVSRQ